MTLLLGTTDVASLYLGTTSISVLYLGTTQIWPSAVTGVTGTIAALELDDVAAVAGDVTAPVFTGVIAALELADTAELVGDVTAPVFTGVVAALEADDAAAVAGAFGPTGVVAALEADDTAAVIGTFAAGGVVYGDDFNRANAATLGAAWTAPSWGINGNRAQQGSGGGGGEYATFRTSLGAPDHWAEFTLPAVNAGGNQYMVINARRPSDTDTDPATGYLGFVSPAGQCVIGRVNSGGYSDVQVGDNLGAWPGAVPLRIEVQGSTIRLYVNNVLRATGTNSSITTGNYTGMNANNAGSVDNFRCGTLPYTPP